MEELILTDPIVVPGTTTTKYRVVRLTLDYEAPPPASSPSPAPGLVVIGLRDDLGGTLTHRYAGAQAIDYMKFINTANFSTKSLHKRILERLAAEGVIPGTVTGTPDPPAGEL